MKKHIRTTAIVLVLLSVLYSFWMYAMLPNRVAIHFDMRGEPNGWAMKNTYFAMFLPLQILLTIGLLWGFPKLLRKIPDALINIPRKDYWFATPERREVAMKRLDDVLVGTALFTNVIILFCTHIVYQENVRNPLICISINQGVVAVLAISLVFVIWAIVHCLPPKPRG